MKHTPGPWRVESANRQNFFFGIWAQVTKTGSMEIARVSGLAEFDRANANLIAAAPELLEACKEALAEFEWIGPREATSVSQDILTKAIAKAEGES